MDIPTQFPFVLSMISLAMGLLTINYILRAQKNFTSGKMKTFIQWILAGVFFIFLTSLSLAISELEQFDTIESQLPGFLFIYLSFICFAVAIMVLREIADLYGFRGVVFFKSKTRNE